MKFFNRKSANLNYLRGRRSAEMKLGGNKNKPLKKNIMRGTSNLLLFLLIRRRYKKLCKELPFTESQLRKARSTHVGMGRGKIKNERILLSPKNLYEELENNRNLFKKRFRITKEQFDELFEEMEEDFGEKCIKSSKQKSLSLKNRILLVLDWIQHYETQDTLSTIHNISTFLVSQTISHILPFLVDFFVRFIDFSAESPESFQHSSLDNDIIARIDGTHHPTERPSALQHLFYSGKTNCHCIQTMLLIGYDGYIKAVETGFYMGTFSFQNFLFKFLLKLINLQKKLRHSWCHERCKQL